MSALSDRSAGAISLPVYPDNSSFAEPDPLPPLFSGVRQPSASLLFERSGVHMAVLRPQSSSAAAEETEDAIDENTKI